jgi:hypothetical protein
MSQTTAIQVNQRALMPVLVGTACAILGFLAGWGIFSRPISLQDAVPADALRIAQAGGEEILQGISPDKLSQTPYTLNFARQYAAEYSAFTRPMSTKGTITWTGTPVVTWSGGNYIDAAMAARTPSGVVMLELRLVHQAGNAWAIDQLLSIQLRQAAQ